MKISFIDFESSEEKVKYHLRIEQEKHGENSFNYKGEILKCEYSALTSDNEFKTLAMEKHINHAINKFKQVGYQEEENHGVGFEIQSHNFDHLELNINSISKFNDVDFQIKLESKVIDQFGKCLGNGSITLTEQDGVALVDDILKVTSNTIANVKIKSVYDGHQKTFTIPVEVVERTATQNEKLGIMVSELMLKNAEKDEMISHLGQQITNLMLETGGN